MARLVIVAIEGGGGGGGGNATPVTPPVRAKSFPFLSFVPFLEKVFVPRPADDE